MSLKVPHPQKSIPTGNVRNPTKVHLENVWTSKQMITEGDAAIPLETTRRTFRNQEKSKQISAITLQFYSVIGLALRETKHEKGHVIDTFWL